MVILPLWYEKNYIRLMVLLPCGTKKTVPRLIVILPCGTKKTMSEVGGDPRKTISLRLVVILRWSKPSQTRVQSHQKSWPLAK